MMNEHINSASVWQPVQQRLRYGGNKELEVNVYLTGYTRTIVVYFKVEDDGVGVPNQDLSSLFHKFFTVDKARQVKSSIQDLAWLAANQL